MHNDDIQSGNWLINRCIFIIYQSIKEACMITPEKQKVLDLFSEGRKFYKLMKFAEAKTKFEEALSIDPNDGPAKVYLLRCVQYLGNPPPDDWDGVFIMKNKK